MPYLELEGLTKRFGTHLAVDGVNLSVERGEVVTLLGPSGCGKTTTLQMIAGFVEPTSGVIRVDGRDMTRVHAARRGFGLMFQSYALFPHMTAAENVSFGLEMRKIAGAERDRRVRDALALVGLDRLSHRYPRQLSGGQQQRVALARALVIEPRLLLLDEPLSNLDAKLRDEMQFELKKIQRQIGITTILVTHDQQEAMALSDRIAVLNAGRIEQLAPPLAVYQTPATSFVASFLGKTNVLLAPVKIVDGKRQAIVEGLTFAAEASVGERAAISVRPEKIILTSNGTAGLSGCVTSCIFQGATWLLGIQTAMGVVTVIRQNDGSPVPREGDKVSLRWRAEDAVVQFDSGSNA